MTEPHDSHHISKIDGRLSKLEGIVDSLADNVARITDDIGRLAEYSRSRTQTQWGNIFAGVTLVIVLVTGYVGLPLSSLDSQFKVHKAEAATEHQKSETTARRELNEALEVGRKVHADLHTAITRLERRLDDVSLGDAKTSERIHSLEREIFQQSTYNAGRPVKYQPSPIIKYQEAPGSASSYGGVDR